MINRPFFPLSACSVAMIAFCSAHGAWAAETADVVEGLVFTPSVKFSVGHDDNIRDASSTPIGATTTVLAPTLKADTKSGIHTLSAAYNGTFTQYQGQSTDNTAAHNLGANGQHELSARARLGWNLNWQESTDSRADSVVQSAEADQWRGVGAGADFSYGAAGAQGRVETGVKHFNKRYQNNLASTEASDVDTNSVYARFLWRVAPATSLLTEASLADSAYRVATEKDSADTRLLLGVTWDITSKTKGSVKFGRQSKDFDDPTKATVSGSTYDAQIQWSPLSYSTFGLTASRAVEDSAANGGYARNSRLGLNWNHQWNDRMSSRVGLNDTTADYQDGRSDDTLASSLGFSYQWNRHVSLGLDLSRSQRDSSDTGKTYTRNAILFSLQAAL